MKKSDRIPMQHPTKKDEFGMPKIQHINAKTVRSGKAAQMGFLPLPNVERAPIFASNQSTAPVPAFVEQKVTPKPKATK